MRKLLLASVALVGGYAGMVSVAHADALVNIAEPGNIPNAILPPGPGTATPSTTPQLPGTVTVRIDARVIVNAEFGSDSGRNPVVTPTAASATSLGSPASNTKLDDYELMDYARIYPQFVGIAANGLKYGAFLEIRQDDGAPPGGGASGSVSGSNRTRAALYFRRSYAYLGTDQMGYLRFGSTDQPTSLFATGTMENYDDGAWNGDLPSLFTSNSAPVYPFPDTGSLYSTEKVVYVSPSIVGFDFGVSFEPSTATDNLGPGNCPYGVTANGGLTSGGQIGGLSSLGCDAASSTSSSDNSRRRNTVDAVLRYRGAFGPVGVAVTAGGMYGGRVLDNSTPAKTVQYNNLAVFDTGAQVTFGGLLIGGHLDYGKFAVGWSGLTPQHEKDSIAAIGGASYALGPFIVGASWFSTFSPGVRNVTSAPYVGNRNEDGFSWGGTYQMTQGVYFFASGVYGARHETGVDLLSGATSTTAALVKTNNNTKAFGGLVGTIFKW